MAFRVPRNAPSKFGNAIGTHPICPYRDTSGILSFLRPRGGYTFDQEVSKGLEGNICFDEVALISLRRGRRGTRVDLTFKRSLAFRASRHSIHVGVIFKKPICFSEVVSRREPSP